MKLKCLPEKIYLFQFLVYASTSKFISQNKNILWYLIKFSIWYLLFSSPCFSVPPINAIVESHSISQQNQKMVFHTYLQLFFQFCPYLRLPYQAFVQAVLLMSVFEQRLSFRMFNNHEIIVKCRWRYRGTGSSTIGSWRSPDGSSGCKASENLWPFYIWSTNKLLKLEETY